jgi:hypothetical protein
MLYKEDENFINKMDYSFFENKNYTTLKELADELNITNYKNKKDLIMNIISFFKNYESIGKQYQKEREIEVRKPASPSETKNEVRKPISPSESKTEVRKSVSPSETKTEVRKPASPSETKTEVRKSVSPSETKTEVRKSTQEKDSKTEIIRKQVSENKENEVRKPVSKAVETKTEVNKTTVSEIKDNKYNIIKQIGNVGKEGITYLVKRNNDGSEFAMKTFKKTKSSKNILIESELQNIASKSGVCPKIIDVNVDEKFIVMEKLDTHLYDIMKKQNGDISKKHQEQIIDIFKKLDQTKVFHADSNILNYMLKNNKLYIIDFGMSRKIDEKLIKKLGDESPNLTFMTLGFVLKLKELKCPPSAYSYLLNFISEANKSKYGIT